MHEMTNFFTSPHTLISQSKIKYVKVKWMWISANYWSKEKNSKDTKFEIASKEGRSYFVPTQEKETQEIPGFRKW